MTGIQIVNVDDPDGIGPVVVIEAGAVSERRTRAARGMPTIDARGGALLPGLWDHHIHLRALAARARSLDLTDVGVDDVARVIEAAARTMPGRWLRVVGYDDTVLGALDAARLRSLSTRDRPIRVQHRSGHQWVVNDAGIRLLNAHGSDVSASGLVWDDDDGIHDRSTPERDRAALIAVRRELLAQGIVGVTDMTATQSGQDQVQLSEAFADGPEIAAFGQAGASGLDGTKIIVAEHSLPTPEELEDRVRAARPGPVAIHAVTAEALVLALSALAPAVIPGDRVEHAFLTPEGYEAAFAHLAVAIGAHPGFLLTHGDRVRAHLPPNEVAEYQRLRSWHDGGFLLLGGTDRPFSKSGPWTAMQAAVDRRTRSGAVINPREALTPEQAFTMFTQPGLTPGAEAGVDVRVGDHADLCVIDQPWSHAREDLSTVRVSTTVKAGSVVWSGRAA